MFIAAMMLAGGVDLPALDRAFAEARSATIFGEAPARAKRARALPARRALERDIDALTALCSAASRSGEPEMFLVRVAQAYGMTAPEAAELRKDCRIVSSLVARRAGYRR